MPKRNRASNRCFTARSTSPGESRRFSTAKGKMLGGGNRFQILGIVALQPGDESYANATGEKRIFSVSLLSASPARIAKDVDVRRPEGQAEIAAGISVLESVVVLGASFGRNDIGDAMNKVGVPGGSEADGLRENRSVSRARDTVQAFVPPVISRNSEARDGAGNVLHLRSFFVERHAGNQVVDALVDGKTGVQIGRARQVGR